MSIGSANFDEFVIWYVTDDVNGGRDPLGVVVEVEFKSRIKSGTSDGEQDLGSLEAPGEEVGHTVVLVGGRAGIVVLGLNR